MSYDPEPEINHYLERLSHAARDLPKARRRELLGEIEQHIRQALAQEPCADRTEMQSLLSQVGDPAEIAAAASDQAETSLERFPGPIASLWGRPRRLILGLLALIVIALVIGAVVLRQSYQPLALAPTKVLTAASVNTDGADGYGAWVGYRTGIGGGPNRPFFGVTIQNTGSFPVRLVMGVNMPIFDVLRGWSSRLLMARGRFVQEIARAPSGTPVTDTNGHIVRIRVWKPGPLQPFQPIDLAPGQIVTIALEGVWHDCQIPAPTGATIPALSFPIRYSFLWKTTTTHIPLPSGMTIAPPNPHPNTDCHQG